MSVPIHLIYARARNGVIGRAGALPWHLPEDLAHFKRSTMGSPVLMGRKTWDSIPPKFRPLPGRLNLVLTRQTNWLAPGATRVTGIEEAAAQCPPNSTLWVIGGAELYALTEPLAVQAVVTEIDADFEGDAYAPVLGPSWEERSRLQQASSSNLRFDLVVYRKKRT